MKPLKKGYEASEENVHVKIAGKIYRCANLKKSGIKNQRIILLAHNDEWHEVDVYLLGGDDSNLDNFKSHVELNNYKLSDFGILQETLSKNYELTHQDYMELDNQFGFSYVYIAKLAVHLEKYGQKTGKYQLKETLKHIKNNGRTIQEYIAYEIAQANEIINNSNKLIKMGENPEITQTERIDYLTSLGFAWSDQENAYVYRYGTIEAPARFEVSLKSIESDDQEEWNKLVERIEFSVPSIEHQEVTEIAETAKSIVQEKSESQETETKAAEVLPAAPINEPAAKKPVSLAVIGNLTPDRIAEFSLLKENQEKIVKENPFIEPTDKASFEKAKKAAAALLKASTAIDSPKDGMKANKNKFLKQLSSVLDNFLDPLAKMTRTAYEKQQLANETWKNKEALRIQNEEKAKLEKINARTQSLFDVPMVFNGTHYTIGNLHIMPSQITSATDDEFLALVNQAKGIKSGLDAAASAESEKDKQIAELKAMLEKLTGTIPEPAKTVEAPAEVKTQPVTAPAVPNTPVSPQQPRQTTQKPQVNTATGELVYTSPADNNKLLLAFDMENLEHVEKQAFLKCRSYYIKGLQDAGKEIIGIFDNPSIEKKAGPLKELGTILKNS